MRYEGDCIGEIDEDGIAQFYPNCKVRKEGDIYIATPHTTNKARRRKRKDEMITVSEQDGKLELAKPPTAMLEVLGDDEPNPFDNPELFPTAVPIQETLEALPDEESERGNNEAVKPIERKTTRKKLFDELYAKYDNLSPYQRKQAIFEEMKGLFKTEEAAKLFVDTHWARHRRNNYVRKQRFKYKAQNQKYQYFVTFTFDSAKHTEESFMKSLKDCFANRHKRNGWLIQGIWERGDENGRLHFHGLVYDPKNKIPDDLEEVTEYNPKTHRMETYKRHKYFFERFGRNEFSEIIPQIYDSAIDYITKYISKHGVRPYYSRGLYSFFRCDIEGKDVIGKMSGVDERDIRLLVFDKFRCWDEGVLVGEVSPEVIAQLPKSN